MNISIGMTGILNFLVTFLLIVGTNSISGYPLNYKRSVSAALVSAANTVICMVFHPSFCKGLLWSGAVLALTSVVAFGCKRNSLSRAVVFALMRFAITGISLGFEQQSKGSLIAALVICLLCLFLYRSGAGKQKFVAVRILHKNRTATLTALLDTGNTLRDPVSGAPVLIVDHVVAERILGITKEQLASPIETLSSGQFPGLRIIPYTAVGQTAGMLLGLRVEQLWIDGKQENMIVAFAPHQIGHGKQFQALAGVML